MAKQKEAEDKKIYVAIKPSLQSEVFRRCVRDDKGNILETLEFGQGAKLELTKTQEAAVAEDLGLALVLVRLQGNKYKPDFELTDSVVAEIAAAKIKDGEQPKRHQLRALEAKKARKAAEPESKPAPKPKAAPKKESEDK